MFKNIVVILFMAAVMVGCKGMPKREPAVFVPVNVTPVIYKVPNSMAERSFYDTVSLESFTKHSQHSTHVLTNNISNKILKVERREQTPNNVSGSGVIYHVRIDEKKFPEYIEYTLTPYESKRYQGGIFLPFKVPHFDITKHLSEAKFEFKIDVNSEYPAQAVKANFDRSLAKSNSRYQWASSRNTQHKAMQMLSGQNTKIEEKYLLPLKKSGVEAVIKVDAYPYRNGSKVVIDSSFKSNRDNNGLIDLMKLSDELTNRVTEIVNL